MTSRIVRSTAIILLFAASALAGEQQQQKRCSATAQECEREIRRMLSGRRYLGLQVVELPRGGIYVDHVIDDSPAKNAGFQEGDRIIAINGRDMSVATAKEFKQALATATESGGRLFVIVRHRGAFQKIDTRLEPYPKEQIDKIVAQHLLQSHTPQQPQMQQQHPQTQSAQQQQQP